MTLIRKMIEFHRLFCTESPKYILGGRVFSIAGRVAYLRGFPRAYVAFMYLRTRDWMRFGY